MLLLPPYNARLLPSKFAQKNHVSSLCHWFTAAALHRRRHHYVTTTAVFHSAGIVAVADVYMAVSIERVQQQIRAVFQSIVPSSLEDCDADTLYLTLRLHQKKVTLHHSCDFFLEISCVCAASFCSKALPTNSFCRQTPHPFLAPALHSKLATVLTSSVSCLPALHPVWPLIINSCCSSKHDGSVSKEGVSALMSLWSKG
jgi:hypothetical protein